MNYYGNHVDASDDSELFERTEDSKDDYKECAHCKDEVHEDETIFDKDSHDRYCFDCMRKGRFIKHLEMNWDESQELLQAKIKELNKLYINLKK
jgi:hypothetical protein